VSGRDDSHGPWLLTVPSRQTRHATTIRPFLSGLLLRAPRNIPAGTLSNSIVSRREVVVNRLRPVVLGAG
jgi:hypothetical protein